MRDARLVGVRRGLGGCRGVRLAFGDDLLHGVQDAAVAGAAAQVAAQGLAGLQLVRRGVALEQVVHGHGHARYAETALHGAALGQRALHVGGLSVGGQALDGAHLAARGGDGGHQTGGHEPPVHLDVAGAALALRAAVLGAREAEALAQYVEQRFADPGVGHGAVGAVDAQDVGGEGVFVVPGCGGGLGVLRLFGGDGLGGLGRPGGFGVLVSLVRAWRLRSLVSGLGGLLGGLRGQFGG